jgi:FK506-binding protein 4/5
VYKEMAEEKGTDVSEIIEEDELDEEPGEEIESAPPLKVGEEREFNSCGLKKKLIKRGIGWETPEFGDEVTVHYVGSLLDGGSKFDSTRDRLQNFTFKVGNGQVCSGLDQGIITMKKGEISLFTVPSELGYGETGTVDVPPNSIVQFEVELISWIRVVDICKDGGIIKRILVKGKHTAQPADLDQVLVKYTVMLNDGVIIAKTPEEGVEFYVKDGHLIPALPKAIKTMRKGEKVNLLVQPQYAQGEGDKDHMSGLPSILPNSVLNINLELLFFKPVIDVTGDLKVMKKIIKEGEGDLTANEGSSVSIRYRAMLEDGSVFESKGFEGEMPLEFITDEEQVIAGLDRAAATMKKGECAILTINPEYGFGSTEVRRDLAVVPPFSNIIYEVEMLDFTKERAPWEMSNDERIQAAGMKKEEGNVLFKNGIYQRATKKYDKAADYVSEDGSLDEKYHKIVKSLRVACWLNAAACALKLNDFKEAIKLCSKVLDVELCNVKALYRRAQAYMETSDLQSAELDIKKALESDPTNKEVKLIQKRLKQHQAKSNKRDAKLYSNMFVHMRRDSTVPSKRLKIEELDEKKDEESTMAMEMEKVDVGSSVVDKDMVENSSS